MNRYYKSFTILAALGCASISLAQGHGEAGEKKSDEAPATDTAKPKAQPIRKKRLSPAELKALPIDMSGFQKEDKSGEFIVLKTRIDLNKNLRFKNPSFLLPNGKVVQELSDEQKKGEHCSFFDGDISRDINDLCIEGKGCVAYNPITDKIEPSSTVTAKGKELEWRLAAGKSDFSIWTQDDRTQEEPSHLPGSVNLAFGRKSFSVFEASTGKPLTKSNGDLNNTRGEYGGTGFNCKINASDAKVGVSVSDVAKFLAPIAIVTVDREVWKDVGTYTLSTFR